MINYPTELEIYGCSKDKLVGKPYDSRYTKLPGVTIDEKTLQTQSGVLSILGSQPFYN